MHSKFWFLLSPLGSSLRTRCKVFSFRLTGASNPWAHAMATYPQFVSDIFTTVYAHVQSLNAEDRSSFYTEFSVVILWSSGTGYRTTWITSDAKSAKYPDMSILPAQVFARCRSKLGGYLFSNMSGLIPNRYRIRISPTFQLAASEVY